MFFSLLVIPAWSADFTCTAGNVACLISAIQVANGNGQDNDIFLEQGTYTLTAVNNSTDGPNGLPSITGRMRIHGPDGGESTIERASGAPSFRLFQISAGGNLRLDRVGLRQGAGTIAGGGGAIANGGTVTLNRDSVYNNQNPFPTAGAISNGGVMTISFTEVKDNLTPVGFGGGINSSGSLVVVDSVIVRNTAELGGGIFVAGGSAMLLRTTVAHNSGSRGGGGIHKNGGVLSIDSSSIDDNLASSGIPIPMGGGLMIFRGTGTTTITNSTVSENRVNDGPGAGIYNAGLLNMTNVTLAGNRSVNGTLGTAKDAGISNDTRTGTVAVQNSIFAQNVTVPITGAPSASNCNSISSLGNNLFDSLQGCTVVLQSGDITGDAGLDAFTDNGTPGNGHYPLLATSRAIDAAAPVCPAKDQIGQSRYGPCDIGSIEFVPQIKTVTFELPPGSSSGAINPRSRGVTPTAILTTDDFDATTVDVNTLRLGKTGTEAAIFHYSLEDLNDDGRLDVVVQFKTQDLSVACGDTALLLKGSTISGTAIQATANFVTVGCQQ